MIEAKNYLQHVLGADLSRDALYSASGYSHPALQDGDLIFQVDLARKRLLPNTWLYFDQDEPAVQRLYTRIRFYSGQILRLQLSPGPRPFQDESPMLAWDPELQARPATLQVSADGWQATDGEQAFFSPGTGDFAPALSPDGIVRLNIQAADQFYPHLPDALPVVRLERGNGRLLTGIAFHLHPGEHFAGSGERFERPDLFGQQIDLVNHDAAGVNNPRTYKNIPFLLSSRGYGLFAHSSARMRLDIGAHSTRSLQWLVEDEVLDLFVIGGGSPAEVLRNYQRLTGFPRLPPVWSFGTWMSRSTYHTDEEASAVAQRLRDEGYPADVINLDTGWFERDWICDWQFSPQNFPDPQGFFRRMDGLGFKVCLWQVPYIHRESRLAGTALAEGYVGRQMDPAKGHWMGYTLDFTDPRAVAWYRNLLEPLLLMGAAVFKTDFGEEVDEGAAYAGMDGRRLHNLYALLYQQTAWETTSAARGPDETLIWARSAWAGSQRYPVHWAGDATATYDSMAGTLCGGLHFGASGFAFWSHDVGGIVGIPDPLASRPSDDLYLRWTQLGVFSSHLRFHGGTPREPWAFPSVAPIVRQWLRFRYALLPYVLTTAADCCRNGLPVLRALSLVYPQDPAAWSIADQFLFGDDFLVCPIMDRSNRRPVYLPQGDWADFWSGAQHRGPDLLPEQEWPPERLPLFLRAGSAVEFAEPVQHTGQLPQARRFVIKFDESYPGFAGSELARYIRL